MELRSDVKDILAAARRGATMIKMLMVFSRSDPLALEPVRLDELCADLMDMLRRVLPETIQLHSSCDGAGDWTVQADPSAVEQILLNLATNARDAMPNGGSLSIKLERLSLDEHRPRFAPGAVPANTSGSPSPTPGAAWMHGPVPRSSSPSSPRSRPVWERASAWP